MNNKFNLFHFSLKKNAREDMKGAYQKERDLDILKLLNEDNPRALVDTYILAEGWTLDRGKRTFIMGPHAASDRGLQAAKRQHRFVQRRECFVV